MNNINNVDLPPLPLVNAQGPRVCAIIRAYIAVLADLPPDQTQVVLAHAQRCPGCANELQQMLYASRLAASLPTSEPSAKVDRAVYAAIAARGGVYSLQGRREARRRRRSLLPSSLVAAVLIVLLATAFGVYRFIYQPAQAFALPSNLSWSGYVLHYNLDRQGNNGAHYVVDCYQDLGKQQLHVEASLPGRWDIVLVGNEHGMLGKDMMHNVAQDNVDGWDTCDPQFNLNTLRQNIQRNQSTYLGKARYGGQEVYEIRNQDGMVLLLDMDYHPVNALQPTSANASPANPRAYHPLYKTVSLMPSSQVGGDMWDRSVPSSFHMGKLPAMP